MNDLFKVIDFSQQPETVLAKFVKQRDFLSNEYISKLANEAINLGFDSDIIFAVFIYFLKTSKKSIDLDEPDYKSIMDKHKFHEALLLTANNYENSNVISVPIEALSKSNSKHTNNTQSFDEEKSNFENTNENYPSYENYSSNFSRVAPPPGLNINVLNVSKPVASHVSSLPSPASSTASSSTANNNKKPLKD